MNKEKFIKEINEILDIKKQFDTTNDKLSSIFGRDSIAENSFLDSFYKLLDKTISILGDSLDIEGAYHWIDWYFYEVIDSKDNYLNCKIDDVEYTCNSTESLWTILQAVKQSDELKG